MFSRSGLGALQDILGAGRDALNGLRGKKTATAVLEEPESPPNTNTPPGSPDGIAQHDPAPKPSPNAARLGGQFNTVTNPSVYQRICDEWAKIADPSTGFFYFCQKYVYISNQRHGYVHFNLYDYQKRFIGLMQEERFVITRKFRQAGCSLVTGVYALWFSLTNPRMQTMVLSIGQRESTKYLQEIRDVYEALPKWLKGGLNDKGEPIKWDKQKAVKDSATELWLPNRSKIRSLPSGKAIGRGFSTKLLIIDEAAFIETIEQIWTSAYPTISNTLGRVVVISTANGVGNWYYRTYQGALANENDFKIAHMEYTEHPDYNDPEWVASTLRQLGQRKWDQEVLGKFLASGNTYITADHIEKMERLADDYKKAANDPNQDKLPKPRLEYGGKLIIWKDFVGEKINPDGTKVPPHRYVIGADCATAGGLDNSAFHVLDITAGEQVAEFKGKLPEDKYAAILAQTGYRYGTAVIAVEVNATAGGATLVSLDKIQNYKRIYSDPETGKLGWTTTSKSRNEMIANLESGLYDDSYVMHGHRTIDELKTFIVTKTGRVQADNQSHDDLIMSWCITTSDKVVRAGLRATPKQPESVLLVNEGGDGNENIISKPVYSAEHDKAAAKAKRVDLLVGTKHGQFIDKMNEINEIAGEDILGWLLK